MSKANERMRALARSIEIWITQDKVHPDFIAERLAELVLLEKAEAVDPAVSNQPTITEHISGVEKAVSKLQLMSVPGVRSVEMDTEGYFLTHLTEHVRSRPQAGALKAQIEELGFEGVGEGDGFIAWRRLSKPDRELCAVFTASQWKQFGAAGCHPFTDEQIDAAAKTREGILGEWGGATCLVSKKLDE